MNKFLSTILRPNDLSLPTRRATGKFSDEKIQETGVWLKRDGNSQVVRERYCSAPARGPRRLGPRPDDDRSLKLHERKDSIVRCLAAAGSTKPKRVPAHGAI